MNSHIFDLKVFYIIMGLKKMIFVGCRKLKYRLHSSISKQIGKPIVHQPILLKGRGTIIFGDNVNFGVVNSPYYYNGYGYLESRSKEGKIVLGNNIHINNNCNIVSYSKNIIIDDNVIIGLNCHIMNNDFHELNTDNRLYGVPESFDVHIKKNVFLGNNVSVLKGVIIGENSVVGAGSVVVSSIPDNTLAAGNPAKVIRKLEL